MRNLIATLIRIVLIATPAVSTAGPLEQDEKVRQLRSEFRNASVPKSFKVLRIGEKWNCQSRGLYTDDFNAYASVVSFERIDGQFHATYWSQGEFHWIPTPTDYGMLSLTGAGYYGSYTGGRVYNGFTLIRIDAQGNLLVEHSGSLVDIWNPNEHWQSVFRLAPESVFNNWTKVLNYTKCNPREPKN